MRSLFVTILLAAIAIGGCGGSSSQDFSTCGNGAIDTGEGCDDGNLSDSDACTSACQPANCGDGVVQAGVEQCDGTALAGTTCASFGRAGDPPNPGCTGACQIDPSPCGALFTPTALATPTAIATASVTPSPTLPVGVPSSTPTTTPTATPAPCGDGLLTPDETCDTCPADCVVQPCTPTTETVAFAFDLVPPPGQSPTGVTVRLAYRSNLVSIPGTGNQRSVFERVDAPPPPPAPFVVNDQDYFLSVVLNRTTPIHELFTVTFDRCEGARAPTVDDFGCALLGCAAGGGPIEGCTCAVRTP